MRRLALCGLLLATAVAVLVDDTTPCTGNPDSTFCGNCQAVYECDSDETLAEKTCLTGNVCEETDDGPVCTDKPSSEVCSCTEDSQCDPYDDTIVMLCNPAGGILMTIPCTGGQQCFGGQCAATTTVDTDAPTSPPPDTCASDSINTWKPIYPGCTAYGFCVNDTATAVRLDCDAGQYYDEIVSACLAAPPTPCTGCEGDDCPDPNDCTLYHSCQGGVITSSYTCDTEPNLYFSVENKKCGENPEECDTRIACGYGSDNTTPIGGGTTSSNDDVTTPSGDATTLPSEECSENNAYQMYPDPDNCKMYYQCALMPSGDYTLVHGTCPGKLVYNPDTDLCDLNSNVPECVV